MECTRQGSPLNPKPSDLDLEGRLRAALINIIIYGALVRAGKNLDFLKKQLDCELTGGLDHPNST